VRAGQAAEAASAPAEALEHYERALELYDEAPEAAARSPLDRVTLLQRAAEAASQAGWWDRSVTLARLALDRVDADRDPLRAGALVERLARYHCLAGNGPRALAAIERAVATIPAQPPSLERARALAAHGQILMLLSHHAEALGRCEEAVAMARQVGDRAVEGHALTSLGTSLSILGKVDEGIPYLEEGMRIANQLSDLDDIGRVHANSRPCWRGVGRAAEAVDVYLAGTEVARRQGAFGRYGSNLLPDAASALLSPGRVDEAEALLNEVFELDLPSPSHRVCPLIGRGTLRMLRGDLAEAEADLRWILEEARAPLDPQSAAPVFSCLAEAATWGGRLAEARAAVAEGLEALAAADEPYWLTELCRTGLAVEAAAAEQARARHAEGEERAARERASALIERCRAAASAVDAASMPTVEATVLTAEAEWSHRRHERPGTLGAERPDLGGAQVSLPGGVQPLAAGGGAAGIAVVARRRRRGARGRESWPPKSARGSCWRRSSRSPAGPGST
jgi:tetratricopeptide (TPR) repeat protein